MAKTDLSGCSKPHVHTWISLRQPLRCGLTILVCSCVMLGAAQCQARGHQEQQEQSVAEAARQERARREHAKKSHVYTDEDLKRAKILTPEDEDRVAARKQAPPAVDESSQGALDAGLQMPELPLGDVARRYRNAKQILQDTAPFHLPFDEPAFAAPVVELPMVEAPLPSFAPSRPKIVVKQPRNVTAPNVTSAAPSAAVRRVDPFAPRLAPVAPRPELHTGTVTPHVPKASASIAPSTPRVEGAAPGSVEGGLNLPKLEPSAPRRSAHVAPAVPHVPTAVVAGTVIAPRIQGQVPGAQLTLPTMEPVAPKIRPHISEANPRVPDRVQHAAPAPRIESMPLNSGTQLALPGIEPPRPSLHVAPIKPHVPAAVSGRAPAAPRLDGGFSGMSGVLPRVEPKVLAPEAALVSPAPVVNAHEAARSVVVRPGDSLWKIALQSLGRGSRWRELMAANPAIVDPTRLEVGASVMVPNVAVTVKSARKSVVVWRGDSLTGIAQANYGRASAWRCIAEANAEIKDPNRIYQGQTLTLPESCN